MKNKINSIKYEYYLVSLSLTVIDFLFGFAYVAFMSQTGLKNYEIGNVLTLWSTILLLTGIPFGFLSDKFSPKLMLGLGSLLAGVGYILFSFSKSLSMFLISITGVALSNSIISRLPVSWLISILKQNNCEDEKNSIIPKGESVAKILTFLLGILLSTILSNRINNIVYLVNGLLSIFLGLFILMFLSESKSMDEVRNVSFSYILKSFIINTTRNRKFSFFCIKFLLFSVAGQIFVYSWQLYSINELGIKSSYLGMMYSSFLLVLALGYYLISIFQKYINAFSCIIIGTITVLVSFFLMYTFKKDWIFLISCLIFELGLALDQGGSLVWIQSEIDDANRSTSLSMLSTIIGVAGILGTSIITYLLKVSTYNILWLTCSLLVLLSLLLLLFIKKILE